MAASSRWLDNTPRNWKLRRLGDLFRERSETGHENLELLAITASQGVVSRAGLDQKDNSNPDKRAYKRILPGDIGYNTMRMWQGVSGLSQLEGIVSPAYTVCTPRAGIVGRYAAHLFKYAPMVHLFRRYSQGLVDDTLNLKYSAFAEISAPVPSVGEQIAIADALDLADRQIRAAEDYVTLLRRRKLHMMHDLFSGRVRVQETNE